MPSELRKILVTGGAGFIGSTFVLNERARNRSSIINLDKLTYAGNLANLASLDQDPGHCFVRGDIADREQIAALLQEHQPDAIVHFAAESHVDRSICGPEDFIQTNVVGTFCLLEEARLFWENLDSERTKSFRFLHVSTDEVYGTLEAGEPAFRETNPYLPNSPYAASKAGSDHLVRAYRETYGLPTLITNCSNNYGPFQFPEKLIPLVLLNALEGKPLPVYGDGRQVRDWLYVQDHCEAIRVVLEQGRVGETYNIGGRSEMANIEVVRALCQALDTLCPDSEFRPHSNLIHFVKDRPGHDRRYAIDCSKMEDELGWRPAENFESGLRKTVEWYLQNQAWVEGIRSGDYRDWIETNYGNREVS